MDSPESDLYSQAGILFRAISVFFSVFGYFRIFVLVVVTLNAANYTFSWQGDPSRVESDAGSIFVSFFLSFVFLVVSKTLSRNDKV